MHLKLRDQQFKTVTQIYRETLPYIKVMVTTNQKSIIDTQKSYQITREENKRRKEQKKNSVHCWWECKLVEPLWKAT